MTKDHNLVLKTIKRNLAGMFEKRLHWDKRRNIMKDSKAPIIGTSLAILSAFLHSLDGLIGWFSKINIYSYYCSGRPPILKANQVNRLSPMTAVEMAFWRCTGQCIWIWPVCYYRYVKNEKHSDLFYKPSYVLTYALVSPMYTKIIEF